MKSGVLRGSSTRWCVLVLKFRNRSPRWMTGSMEGEKERCKSFDQFIQTEGGHVNPTTTTTSTREATPSRPLSLRGQNGHHDLHTGANKLSTVNQGWNPVPGKQTRGVSSVKSPESALRGKCLQGGKLHVGNRRKNMYLLHIVRLLLKLFISQNHSAK